MGWYVKAHPNDTSLSIPVFVMAPGSLYTLGGSSQMQRFGGRRELKRSFKIKTQVCRELLRLI